MSEIGKVIRAEMVRLSRREARKLTAPLRAEIRKLRQRDTERRQEIAALQTRIRGLQAKERLADATAKAASGVKGRLSPRLILSLRKKLGLSQTEFAKLLDVSAITIGQWERGKMKPRSETRAKILSFRGMGRREAKAIMENLCMDPAPLPKQKAKAKAVKSRSDKRRRPARTTLRRNAK